MLESSKDILNYTLAASAVVLTFFISWLLWYFIKIFRDVERVIDRTTSVIEKFSSVLDLAKDQLRNVASVIPLVIKGGEKIVDLVKSMRDKRTSTGDETKTNTKKRKENL